MKARQAALVVAGKQALTAQVGGRQRLEAEPAKSLESRLQPDGIHRSRQRRDAHPITGLHRRGQLYAIGKGAGELRKPNSVRRSPGWAIIHLGPSLPIASCDLPGDVRAVARRGTGDPLNVPLFGLAPHGVYRASHRHRWSGDVIGEIRRDRCVEIHAFLLDSARHLSSSNVNRVSAAMDLLVDSNRARLIPALILYHDSEELVLKGLDIISRIDEQDWRPHAQRLSQSKSVVVRTAALRALGRACEADLVRDALDDESPEVRAHAAFQLARCEGSAQPTEHPAIVQLLQDAAVASAEDRVQMRLGLLKALREDADERWVEVLLGVAESDRSPRVVDAVAHAVMRVPDPRFVDVLVRSLDLRDARAAVRDALVRIGTPAMDALSDKLMDPQTPLLLRRQIPAAIASFGTQRAADLLTQQLSRETDGLLRYRVLRGLSRLVSDRAVHIDKAVIEAELERNLVEHLRLMSLLVPLDEDEDVPMGAQGSDMLLTGLLRDKMGQAAERAFRLFKILHPHEDVRSIHVALGSPNARTRAHAQEFLDALAVDCTERCRTLFRIIADDLTLRDKVRRAEALIPEPPKDRVEALRLLLKDNDPSVVALATYHATALDVAEVGDDVASAVTVRPALRNAAEIGAAEASVRATSAEMGEVAQEVADG